jgi:hypothetical protein
MVEAETCRGPADHDKAYATRHEDQVDSFKEAEANNAYFRSSSLLLAIIFHINGYFSFVYAFIIGSLILEKRFHWESYSTLHMNLLPVVYLIWVVAEFVRLKSGAQANVEELVSPLAASMIMCIFPQLPALIYIGFLQEHVFPVDQSFSICIIVLTSIEFVVSFSVLRRMIRVKTAEYYSSVRQEQIYSRKTQMRKDADIVFWSRKKTENEM